MKRLVVLLLLALPQMAAAQLLPGHHYILPTAGALLPQNELLRSTAIDSTGRLSDPTNPVVTDIALDPGVYLGLRYAYALNRRLAIEVEVSGAIAVHVIRQLEIKPDAQPGDEPQYDTTTQDAFMLQYGVNLTYFLTPWKKAQPLFTFGFGNHHLNLKQKGEVNPDPVMDRYILAGLGFVLPAGDRLGIRVEVRDYMYNFRYDNQFVDPTRTERIVWPRDIYLYTSTAGTKFQNDVVLSAGFMVRMF